MTPPFSDSEPSPRSSKDSLPEKLPPASGDHAKRSGSMPFVSLEETKLLNIGIDRFDDLERVRAKDHLQFPLTVAAGIVLSAIFVITAFVLAGKRPPVDAVVESDISLPGVQAEQQPAVAANPATESAPATNELFLEAYRPKVDQARDAIWSFMLDPQSEPPWVDVAWDVEGPEAFKKFFSNPSHRIRTLTLKFVGGRAKDGVFDLAFNARSDLNSDGSLVEVRVRPDGRPSIDWVKFAQHHFKTFPHFWQTKQLLHPKIFYLSIARKHAFSETEFPSGRATERFVISGTNPIHWAPSYVVKGSLAHRKLVAEVGWGEMGQVRAMLEWKKHGDDNRPFLFVTDVVETNWLSEATR